MIASPRSSSGGVSATTAGSRLSRDELQRLADHAAQVLGVERLEQVVVGPLLHRLDGSSAAVAAVMKMTGMRASTCRIRR